ncbi:hypothetical protein M2272_005585 [Mycobacterium frederiksbergense]|uniref:Uncharacterized protein n=1 Tax=Mycolicibacterium frederiksbergense TaxID=117567 RepID=A0ABT6L7K2_9MYCO|nr:DUF5682 family protein [Mycolicibacterium frederiksbergense]MDH6198921.1 hypothetical protein [Mycolicibacterium frederiksbergense]
MAPEPRIVGVRHHSPACARLVVAEIERLRPAHVLIEGPCDFNERIDELDAAHRLPIAIYSYLSASDVHRGSWSPLAEHSPEWQALWAGRRIGAQVRFIDLPAWHDAFADLTNRYADDADEAAEHRAADYTAAVARELGIDSRDALWDHLFESEEDPGALAQRLSVWFTGLRGEDPGSAGNAAREELMAHWIAWAVHRDEGPVLVVCGGYHAPALAARWPQLPETNTPPAVPVPPGAPHDVRHGSYLVPFGFRQLDAFTGYASGMPSPSYYQWVWEDGVAAAGRQLLHRTRDRLRDKKLPVSTATLQSVYTHAHGLARLRGHAVPLRCDWLDSVAAGWVTDALEVPLPWSYRGPLAPGTDPVLVEVMDVLSGDQVGALAPGTPQPPLVAAVAAELAAHNLPVAGDVTLDLLSDTDRQRSRVLHRLALLDIPGTLRCAGPRWVLDAGRNPTEQWQLDNPPSRLAALIEAGAWGATLLDAARNKWAATIGAGVGVAELAAAVDAAAASGLGSVQADVIGRLRETVAAETDLGALGAALRVLLPLARNLRLLGLDAVEAIADRAVWLLEPPAPVAPAEVDGHLRLMIGLRDLVRAQLFDLMGDRIVAVLGRKAASVRSDPASRGAALGAVISLGTATDTDPLAVLSTVAVARLGDALAGLLALAREELLSENAFVAGLDALITGLDGDDFVGALPALRAAFAWLPPRERGEVADAVLGLHGAVNVSRRVLIGRLDADPQTVAATATAEHHAVERLQSWGVWP